ncbi:uncharacterized protein LOC112145523 [Oryzias melastigma]|uniref:uncharacterized protein LOC112145523 n=1 Tax=Oryzias melastigma TaxID=30732 RepID=UPI000CF7E31F|nr:uncharacterized protein LOC112145523 [Oryzias melastigma]
MKTISLYFCLFCAAFTENYEINIEGFEGRPTSFSCSHKLAKSRTKYFCRDPCQAEEDILARVKPGERTAKGRLSLKDFGNGVFNVTFNPLQQSDTHLYYCSVDRVGFDTFTSVNIRVQKAVTTLPAHVTSALPSQHVTNSTLLLMDSSKQPASSSIATTPLGNEKKVNQGTVLYAALGAFATLTVLMLAAVCRKLKGISKPQLTTCSTNREPDDAFRPEVQSKNDSQKKGSSVETVSQSSSVNGHHQTQNLPKSRTQELRVYENLSCLRDTAGLRFASCPKNRKETSEIYINVLP